MGLLPSAGSVIVFALLSDVVSSESRFSVTLTTWLFIREVMISELVLLLLLRMSSFFSSSLSACVIGVTASVLFIECSSSFSSLLT